MSVADWFRKTFLKQKAPRVERRSSPVARALSWFRGDYSLHNSELLFAAVSRISSALATMQPQLYKGPNLVKSDLADMVGFSPNPNMTASQFFKAMEACRCTNGNCYALKTLGPDMELLRLDIIDPARVTPTMDIDSGELYFRINPEGGQELIVHNYYVVHVPFLSANGYTGVNPVSVLQDTLGYAEEIQKFSAAQLQKGINAAVIIEAPANLGEEQVEQAIESLQKTYKSSGGTILFLESGLQGKSLNLSPVDSKIFEVEKITRGKVAMVYGIPAHLLGDYSDTSFSSQEQQMLEFLSLTMLPIVTAYEQELNRKLLTSSQRRRGYAFRFNMDVLLRADAATMADVNQKAIRGGWKLINEVRAEKGMQPLVNGSRALASRDLIPLDYLVEHPKLKEENNGQAD